MRPGKPGDIAAFERDNGTEVRRLKDRVEGLQSRLAHSGSRHPAPGSAREEAAAPPGEKASLRARGVG